jgi:hypothetical protein
MALLDHPRLAFLRGYRCNCDHPYRHISAAIKGAAERAPTRLARTLLLESVAILGLNPEPIDLENPLVGPSILPDMRGRARPKFASVE